MLGWLFGCAQRPASAFEGALLERVKLELESIKSELLNLSKEDLFGALNEAQKDIPGYTGTILHLAVKVKMPTEYFKTVLEKLDQDQVHDLVLEMKDSNDKSPITLAEELKFGSILQTLLDKAGLEVNYPILMSDGGSSSASRP